MTFNDFLWVVIIAWVGSIFGAYVIGAYACQEDTWTRGRHSHPYPRTSCQPGSSSPGEDTFGGLLETAGRERLASTTDLLALSYDGEIAALREHTDRFIAMITREDYSA